MNFAQKAITLPDLRLFGDCDWSRFGCLHTLIDLDVLLDLCPFSECDWLIFIQLWMLIGLRFV